MQRVIGAASLEAFASDIEQNGFALWPDVVSDERLAKLRVACESADHADASARRANQMYARRNLLSDVPEIHALAHSEALQNLVRAVLGPRFIVVRGLLFDKVPTANWHVGWHQDLMIPLAEQCTVHGFSAWSVKAGVVHAKPPPAILEQMLTLRVHLDDCEEGNGPLRLVAGSHRQGELTKDKLLACVQPEKTYVCLAKAGEVLAMRPLALHASSPAQHPAHRRVVHLEYARPCLPAPLQWPVVDARLP